MTFSDARNTVGYCVFGTGQINMSALATAFGALRLTTEILDNNSGLTAPQKTAFNYSNGKNLFPRLA